MFNFNLFCKRKPSGQVELTKLESVIAPLSKEEIFDSAVKECAQRDLAIQIQFELDCFVYGKDCTEQTKLADKAFKDGFTGPVIKEKYPRALREYGYYKMPNAHTRLAEKLAAEWIRINAT